VRDPVVAGGIVQRPDWGEEVSLSLLPIPPPRTSSAPVTNEQWRPSCWKTRGYVELQLYWTAPVFLKNSRFVFKSNWVVCYCCKVYKGRDSGMLAGPIHILSCKSENV
jgi:hypothetical protein